MKDISVELKQYYDIWMGLNAIYESWAKQHNVTVNAIFTLNILLETRECTQSFICKELYLPKQTVNAVLDSLAKSGYVEKKTSDVDRRHKIILLTPQGLGYAKHIIGELNAFEGAALCKMTHEERTSMISNNLIFIRHLGAGLNN